MSPLKIGWIRTRKFIQPSILGVNSLLVPGKVNTIKSQRFDRFLSTFFPPTKCNCVDLSLHQNRNKKTSCKAPYDWKPNKHGITRMISYIICRFVCFMQFRLKKWFCNVKCWHIVDPNFATSNPVPADVWPSDTSKGKTIIGIFILTNLMRRQCQHPWRAFGLPLFEGRWKIQQRFWMRFKAQCQVGGGHLEQHL